MRFIYILTITIISLLINQVPLKAQTNFLDFKFILNESVAGKKANLSLKNELDKSIKKLKDTEKQLQKEEKEIIQQKKILSPEDYKKKLLR